MKKQLSTTTAVDLSHVSDEDLKREYMRRFNQRRARSGGRPKRTQSCPKCGAQLGARELRAHTPSCEPGAKFFIPEPQATGRTTAQGHSEYVTAEGVRLAWSGQGMPLPNIGAVVNVTMNNLGLATVEGYFSEAGYLGVMTRLHNPPEWLKKQRTVGERRADAPQWIKDGIGCEFGSEISAINAGPRRRQA